MRQANILLSCLCALLLLLHTIPVGLVLLGVMDFAPWIGVINMVLLIVMMIHAVLSLILVIPKLKASGRYVRENAGVWIQRLLGLGALIFSMFHRGAFGHTDAATGQYIQAAPTLGAFALQLLLAWALAIHLAIGAPKAALALGFIAGEGDMGRARRISWTACGLLLGYMTLAFFIYFLGGGAA